MLTMPVERITDASSASGLPISAGARLAGAEKRVALRIHNRNRDDFLIAERDDALAQAVLRLGVRQAMRRKFRGRQARRKFVVAVVPRHFFDQIDFARHVLSPGRLATFPHGGDGAVAAAICVHAHGMKTQRAENCFDLAVRHIRAHHAQKFLARKLDFRFRLAVRDRRPRRRQEVRRPRPAESVPRAPRSELRHFRIGAALEAIGSFGAQAERFRSAANGNRIEPRAIRAECCAC